MVLKFESAGGLCDEVLHFFVEVHFLTDHHAHQIDLQFGDVEVGLQYTKIVVFADENVHDFNAN